LEEGKRISIFQGVWKRIGRPERVHGVSEKSADDLRERVKRGPEISKGPTRETIFLWGKGNFRVTRTAQRLAGRGKKRTQKKKRRML